MNNQTLSIAATNLDTNAVEFYKLTASNTFMIAYRYAQLIKRNIFIDSWTLESNDSVCGNKGLNAGAYLHEIIEEL